MSQRSLFELATEPLALIRLLSATRMNFADPIATRTRAMETLQAFSTEALSAGYSKTTVDDALYALVATIDELAQVCAWAGRDLWGLQLLQVSLFQEGTAGRGFFERLARIDAAKGEALIIYAACIAMGYRGQYRLHGEASIAPVLDRLQKINPASSPWLADALPKTVPRRRIRRPPWPALAAGLLVVGILIAFGLGRSVVWQARQVAQMENNDAQVIHR